MNIEGSKKVQAVQLRRRLHPIWNPCMMTHCIILRLDYRERCVSKSPIKTQLLVAGTSSEKNLGFLQPHTITTRIPVTTRVPHEQLILHSSPLEWRNSIRCHLPKLNSKYLKQDFIWPKVCNPHCSMVYPMTVSKHNCIFMPLFMLS